MRIFVIGGINMDISGVPAMQLKQHDSNPGRVVMEPGGAGRNIAENLARLGAEVELVTVFGDDAFARELEENCKKRNISIRHSVHTEGRSCIYVAVRESDGSKAAVVTDMDIMEEIDELHLRSILKEINAADACVIDTNLSMEAIDYIAEHVTVPIFADPVSVSKAIKLKGILGRLTALKPSREEAGALTDIDMSEENSAWVAAEVLNEKGVDRVFISLGGRGIIFAGETEAGFEPARHVTVESHVGEGDSVTAALCYAYLAGMNLRESAVFANRAACLTLQTEENVSREISLILDENADLHEIDEMEEFLR